MILPSETAEAGNPNIVSLPSSQTERRLRVENTVSRLEFHAVRPSAVDVVSETELVSNTDEVEVQLKAEVAALDARLQSQERQILVRIEAAQNEARVETRREMEKVLEEKIAAERECVVRSSEQFLRERSRYFTEIESEVVKLALAIAKRVLHRELKLDPLLLAAAVRVALEKVKQDSAIDLRVPAEDAAQWRELFASVESVHVVGDERLVTGECVLDTQVGKVELGVSAQLVEIERGFFDLLQQRPS